MTTIAKLWLNLSVKNSEYRSVSGKVTKNGISWIHKTEVCDRAPELQKMNSSAYLRADFTSDAHAHYLLASELGRR